MTTKNNKMTDETKKQVEKKVQETDMSKVITLKISEGPVVGIVGLCHGDEPTGGFVLDELQRFVPDRGTLKLIYANLPAARANKRLIEANLNRVFPGDANGKLEERIAFGLQEHLKDCNIVIDLHEMYEKTPGFVISDIKSLDDSRFYDLARKTGLGHYTITGPKTRGGSLIDFVNKSGGLGLSIECGKTATPESLETARKSVRNILISQGMLSGELSLSNPSKYVFEEMVCMPEDAGFVSNGSIKNLELLRANTVMGTANGSEVLSPKFDCYPLFYNGGTIVDGKMLFVAARKL